MKATLIVSLSAIALLAACSSTQYVMSTKQGNMITTSGKPQFDEKMGTYTYTDTEGKKGVIRKDEVVQVIER